MGANNELYIHVWWGHVSFSFGKAKREMPGIWYQWGSCITGDLPEYMQLKKSRHHETFLRSEYLDFFLGYSVIIDGSKLDYARICRKNITRQSVTGEVAPVQFSYYPIAWDPWCTDISLTFDRQSRNMCVTRPWEASSYYWRAYTWLWFQRAIISMEISSILGPSFEQAYRHAELCLMTPQLELCTCSYSKKVTGGIYQPIRYPKLAVKSLCGTAEHLFRFLYYLVTLLIWCFHFR